MDEQLIVVIGAGRYPKEAPEIKIRDGVEDSLIPSLVLEASIKRYSPRTRVISTYGMERPRLKNYKNPTPFSLVRFMVPKLCDFEGWALYCDADQVVFTDVRELLELKNACDNPPAIWIAKAERCTGVIFMDTSRLRHWDAWDCAARVDSGMKYGKMMLDLNGHGFDNFGDLGGTWNSRDRHDADTKLLHYTNLSTQPWKFPGQHPLEHIWGRNLVLAVKEGFLRLEGLDDNCRKIYHRAKAQSANERISP